MKKKTENTLVWILVVIYCCMPVILVIIGFCVEVFSVIDNPSSEEISKEFDQYEKTNNAVVVEDYTHFYFGCSTIDLRKIVGNDVCITGDWLITEDKLYYSLYEINKNKQSYCTISSCDFYGNNNNQLFSIELNANYKSELVEVYDNAFYISNRKNANDGTKIEVFFPLENRQEEIFFKGNAYDYVETLRQTQIKPYKVISENKNEIIIKNEHTLQEYVINEDTLHNSLEGKSLLKFEHKLKKAFVNKRIFVLAYTFDNSISSLGAVVYEYDIENNKLVFQNICEISAYYDNIQLVELT